jgi:hypothetical protein
MTAHKYHKEAHKDANVVQGCWYCVNESQSGKSAKTFTKFEGMNRKGRRKLWSLVRRGLVQLPQKNDTLSLTSRSEPKDTETVNRQEPVTAREPGNE